MRVAWAPTRKRPVPPGPFTSPGIPGAAIGGSICFAERLVYLVGLVLAAWVGAWGTFAPEFVDWALPWLVPPLHARFFGAMYLSGAAFLLGAFVAPSWPVIRIAVPMTGIWTGGLLLASLFHLELFDWSRGPVWVWFAAYALLPTFALWVMWRRRSVPRPADVQRLPNAMRTYLAVQGAVLLTLSLALLLMPDITAPWWPWTVPVWLARLYSAPFLAYAIGSLLVARRGAFIEARLFFWATFLFAAVALTASVQYRHLFSVTSLSTWLWFGSFTVAVCVLAAGAGLPWLTRVRHREEVAYG